jgi:P-type E1-E2 ATPase
LILLSGDRESEVRDVAQRLGIGIFYGNQSPEEKLAVVQRETAHAGTLFVGDGINDAPAMMAASAGVAFGPNSDVTAEAAGAVVLDASLAKVDELIHIGRRMRVIALQSALGGMALSVVGMIAALLGYLPPVAGALAQEAIDLGAVMNALRMAAPVRDLSDFD